MVNIRLKKKLAARTLKVGVGRVWFDPDRQDELEGLDTRGDVRALKALGVIRVLPKVGQVHRKRFKRGPGRRKGKMTARLTKKERWMMRVRAQRKLLRYMRDEGSLTPREYRKLYGWVKGGMFRSKAHLREYVRSHYQRGESRVE